MTTERRTLADLPPDAEARVEAARAYRRTPEGRAELERVRAAVRQDFPPLAPDPELLTALGALRVERERQGLSLADLAERTQMDASTLANLEAGTMPNPTVQTLRAYAHALGKQLSWTIQDPAPTT
jgi:ribosome-binding protein aMBF1 (putative translation factor)